MSDTSKAGAEPSMDDILASIRKILNEDEVPGAPALNAAPPPAVHFAPSTGPAPGSASDAPLMLTEEMLVAEPPMAAPPELPPAPADTVFEAAYTPPPMEAILATLHASATAEPPVPAPLPPPFAPSLLRRERPASGETELVAPAAAAAAAASMGQLLRAVSQERSATVTRGGPSIEDVVREEVRPILKEWLDAHLPGIVERAVRAEIERVVGRNI